MKRRSMKILIPLYIGQICTLRVPVVDHEPADPRTFLVACDVPGAKTAFRTTVPKSAVGKGYVKCIILSYLDSTAAAE
ncbi:hypothetical protein T4E_8351 [Trichinella pseudospiralis]|uniref:Uncharacterized protein n=1 Tax=Trichinella pseudospiralis TaxID=6337 RepID=A0A0V0XHR2_TRIPS|nr:hypothetical protein T4E_8351 [Trichinella pseudospiralis]